MIPTAYITEWQQTSEFQDNLERKRSDRQFCQDIIPLLRTGIDYVVNAAAERVANALLARIDSTWVKL